MASGNGSSVRQPLGLPAPEDLAARLELVEHDRGATPRPVVARPAPESTVVASSSAAPASMAAHLARLAELASMRATIAQEEAQNLADLARMADTSLAGSAEQSVTSTVSEAPSKTAAPAPAQDYLSKQGVADVLGCHPRTVRRMELDGELPEPVVVGRLRRWRRSDIEGWIEAQRAAPGSSSR